MLYLPRIQSEMVIKKVTDDIASEVKTSFTLDFIFYLKVK